MPKKDQPARPYRMRLYVDESGSAGPMNKADPGSRYLGLVGVQIPQDGRHTKFCEIFNALKREHLPLPQWSDRDEPCILHREDIVNRRAPHFVALRDDAARKRFNAALLKAIEDTQFVLYGVVLDKQTHHDADYRTIKDDYHYCMEVLLERYCGRMFRRYCEGDVMAESRGGSQDHALKGAFTDLVRNGGRYFSSEHRKRLTSQEIKLKPKKANVLGLQLADLLARDVKREILAENGRCDPPTGFAAELKAVLSAKYNRHLRERRIRGYGQVFLE